MWSSFIESALYELSILAICTELRTINHLKYNQNSASCNNHATPHSSYSLFSCAVVRWRRFTYHSLMLTVCWNDHAQPYDATVSDLRICWIFSQIDPWRAQCDGLYWILFESRSLTSSSAWCWMLDAWFWLCIHGDCRSSGLGGLTISTIVPYGVQLRASEQ